MDVAEQVLWLLRRQGDELEVHSRPVGAGTELCFVWNGNTVVVKICRDAGEADEYARAKRKELEGRGWVVAQ
jgi:hypothetical protein